MGLSVSDIMSTDLRKVSDADKISHVRDIFELQPVSALPVVDDSGAMVGIITSSDVVGDLLPGETPVTEVMAKSVLTVDRHAGPQQAARQMLDYHCHHLVVTEGDTPCGMLSSFDLLKVFAGA